MPQVSLKDYAASVAQSIQDGNIDGAIAHCRHILSHYPKYLPAYRLLARACLEKGDLAHASHFFQCVLSVDPEDADAWMNLALLSDDLGELEQATWLMERAFDVVPGNAQVRNHLRQLYARRDGVDRSRIKLSGGALARLYAAGGFYRQATEELRKLLQAGTDLPPLHVAQLEVTLATALWHSQGMAPMADQVCHSLTSKFPNCLQANLIMAQIRTGAGKDADAEPYMAVVHSVDPEGLHAYNLLGDQSPVPQTRVEIPYLESDVQPATEQLEVVAPAGDDTSWLDGIGEAIEAGPESVSAVSEEAQPPVWLQEWGGEEVQAAPSLPVDAQKDAVAAGWIEGIGVSEVAGAAAAEPVAEADLPDWLRELGAEPAPQAERETTPEPAEAALRELDLGVGVEIPVEGTSEPSAVGLEEPVAAVAEQELPEWLQELTVSAPREPESGLEPGGEQVTTPTAQDKLPDWLAELGAGAEDSDLYPPAVAAGIAAEEVGPDALVGRLAGPSPEPEAEELAEPVAPVEAVAEPVAEEELPDWLRELRSAGAEEAASPEGPVAIEQATEEELPAWLQELEPEALIEDEGEPTLVSEARPETLAELEPPSDWLNEPRAQGPAVEAILPGEERWTTELAEEIEPVSLLEEPSPEVGAELLQPAIPDSGTLEPAAEEALPDWLQELRSEGVVEELVAPTGEQEALQPTSEEEIPGWLKELSPEAEEWKPAEPVTPFEPAAQHVAEEELPDWLRELRSEGVVEELVSPEEQVAIEPATEEELPVWLRELEPEVLEEEGEPTLVGEVPPETPTEQPPDWLHRLETVDEALLEEEPVAPSSVSLQEQVAPALESGVEELLEEELPEWLAQEAIEAEHPEATLAAEQVPDQAVSEPRLLEQQESIPPWLSELEAEIAGLPVAAASMERPSDTSEAIGLPVGLKEQEPVEPPTEVAEEEWALPAGAVAEEALAAEPGVTAELEPAAAVEVETPLPAAGIPPVAPGVPEWLTELEQELGERVVAPDYEAEASVPAQAAEIDEMAWLQEPTESAGDVRLPGEDLVQAEAAQRQPEWLGAPLDGQISEITVEEMPDWLRQLHAAEPAVEQAQAVEAEPMAEDWVQAPTAEETPRPSDMPQTLVAEGEESQLAPVLDLALEGPQGVTEVSAPAEETRVVEPAAEVPQTLRHLVEPGSAQDDYQAHIALARAYARAGNLGASTDEYEQLAKVPSVSDILVKDLEDLVASHPDFHAFHRVLGDAYMRAGRLQDALNAYREALVRL